MLHLSDEMGKKCHTVGTVPKSNIKISERGKIDTPSIQNMTTHFSGLERALQ